MIGSAVPSAKIPAVRIGQVRFQQFFDIDNTGAKLAIVSQRRGIARVAQCLLVNALLIAVKRIQQFY